MDKDGRKPSIWDTFSHIPGKTHNGDTGDTADDFYNLYEEDIAIMQDLGIEMFRFSLSWSRILPDGKGKVILIALHTSSGEGQKQNVARSCKCKSSCQSRLQGTFCERISHNDVYSICQSSFGGALTGYLLPSVQLTVIIVLHRSTKLV